MRKYGIRVELDERFDPDDVRLDLQTNRLHPLHKHDLHLAVSPSAALCSLSPSLPSREWNAVLTANSLAVF